MASLLLATVVAVTTIARALVLLPLVIAGSPTTASTVATHLRLPRQTIAVQAVAVANVTGRFALRAPSGARGRQVDPARRGVLLINP